MPMRTRAYRRGGQYGENSVYIERIPEKMIIHWNICHEARQVIERETQ